MLRVGLRFLSLASPETAWEQKGDKLTDLPHGGMSVNKWSGPGTDKNASNLECP